MSLRINTNIAALNAHKSMIKNDNALSSSLEKLASGLRINKAADDASGMAIADSLKSQALGLGQAIRNANDGISMVQTADGALDESINIINTIRTKAIQSAQDGQTTDSRKAIQADIDKLMEELDLIANTTAFNNQKLLSGNYVNKKFQIGAYKGETVNISIGSSESTKIGHATTADLTISGNSAGTVELGIYSNLQNQTFKVQSVDVQFNNNAENGMVALANAINKLSDVLGISAKAVVKSEMSGNVQAGTTDTTFAINGVTIGSFDVIANDANGALTKAINQKTSQHGVFASTDSAGRLSLTSTDGRAIQVTSEGGTATILGNTDLSTLGTIQLAQQGSNQIIVTDIGGGNVVSLTSSLETSGATNTTIDSTLTNGSLIQSGSVLAAGFTTGQDLVGTTFTGNLTSTESSTLAAGTVLGDASILGSGTVLTGDTVISGVSALGGNMTVAAGSILGSSTTLNSGTVIQGNSVDASLSLGGATTGVATIANDSVVGSTSIISSGTVLQGTAIDAVVTVGATTGVATIATGSVVGCGSVLASGTVLTNNSVNGVNTVAALAGLAQVAAGSLVGSGTTLAIGTVLASGEYIDTGAGRIGDSGGYTVSNATVVTSGDKTIVFDIKATAGSILCGTNLYQAGTYFTANSFTTSADLTVAADMTLKTASTLTSSTTFAAGTVFSTDTVTLSASFTATADMTLQTGATLQSNSLFSVGTVFTADDLILSTAMVTNSDMTLVSGSAINTGSILTAGTVIAGANINIQGAMTVASDMTLGVGSTISQAGSTLAAGSTIGASGTLNGDINVSADFTVAAASVLGTGSVIANGSTLGGAVTLANDETVAAGTEMLVGAGSTLAAGSTIKAGTMLTNDIVATDGTYSSGTLLESDITTSGTNGINFEMTLQGGSVLKAGSVLGANAGAGTATTTATGASTMYRLSDVNVLTQEGAQIAISVADSALKDLDKVRSDLGSVQNQLTSTIANLSVVRINIFSAESSVRDVDFAEEASNFSKMQVLTQAGSFAMAQANKSAQLVLTLLQG